MPADSGIDFGELLLCSLRGERAGEFFLQVLSQVFSVLEVDKLARWSARSSNVKFSLLNGQRAASVVDFKEETFIFGADEVDAGGLEDDDAKEVTEPNDELSVVSFPSVALSYAPEAELPFDGWRLKIIIINIQLRIQIPNSCVDN